MIIPAVFTSPGPVLFQLGPITLRWYGLLIALAVLIGLNLSSWLAKQRNLESGLISDLLPILVLAAIIGARLYYVAFEWRSYQNSWWDVFAIWQGGIAIHGALIGGTISVILFCRWRKISPAANCLTKNHGWDQNIEQIPKGNFSPTTEQNH